MIKQLYKDIYDEELAKDAIINDRHTMHKEDYLMIHILLKKYNPKTFMELGTNTGFGTLIIKNAIPDTTVYSLDLPDELSSISKQHPLSEGKPQGVGYECLLPYIQLRGDSIAFNYTKYPCEGYFVDTDHTYTNVVTETFGLLQCKPKLVIYHDSDVPEVYNAIVDAMVNEPYKLFRITDTRVAYAVRK